MSNYRVLEQGAATAAVPAWYRVSVQVESGVWKDLTYYYVTRPEQVAHYLQWSKDVAALGYDLETSGLSPWEDRVATLQLGNPLVDDPRAYVFDVRLLGEALEPVYDQLRSTDKVKVGQNLGFEYRFSKQQLGVAIRQLWDTQLSEQVLRQGLFSAAGGSVYGLTSMAALAKRYLRLVLDKDQDLRTGFYATPAGGLNERQLVYAAGDVVYPFFIAKYQRKLLAKRKLMSIAHIEMRNIPPTKEAELMGMRVDVPRWLALWQEAVKQREETTAALDALLVDEQGSLLPVEHGTRPLYLGGKSPVPINYASSYQVRWLVRQVCEHRRWPIEVITSSSRLLKVKAEVGANWMASQEGFGRKVTAKDVPNWMVPEDKYCVLTSANKDALLLGKLRNQLPADLVDLLVQYSKCNILCTTFGKDFLTKHLRPDTGAIHTEFHQGITATGRYSTRPNTQNYPHDPRYRRCFIPKDGYSFTICDYSQIEPRITAQMSGDPQYVSTFRRGDDLYLATAEAMLGTRPDPTTPQGKVERSIFKVVVLALAYSMHARSLRDRLTLALHDEIVTGRMEPPTYEYALELWTRFFEVHRGVQAFQELCTKQADPSSPRKLWDDMLQAEVTWVTSVCGRKRFFPPDAADACTQGPNVGPQSGSATITKYAIALIQDEIDEHGWDACLINAIHDELVYQVRDDQAAGFAKVQKRLMEAAGQKYCPDIPIKAEFPDGSEGVVPYWTKSL